MSSSISITRIRFGIVLALVFVSTLAAYLLAYLVYAPLAAGVAIAWGTTILVLILYLERKRSDVLGLEDVHQELRAQMNLQPLLQDTFLPYSFWAMEPGNMLRLLATIQFNDYRTIVECGSGISTILIGRMLKQLGGGHLYSLEEDANWHRVMTHAVEHDGLADCVTLIHAPLEHHPESGAPWYDVPSAGRVYELVKRIDLLLVDGPKSVSQYSRYPALPYFAALLDESSLIVLDDSKRPAEKAVIRRWKESYNLSVEEMPGSLHGQSYVRLRDSLPRQGIV